MPKTWKRWTSDDIRELYSLCCDGEPLNKIATIVGRTPQAVRTAVRRRLGKWRQTLRNGRPPSLDMEVIVLDLVGSKGMSQRRAGAVMGKGHRTVGRVVARLVNNGLLRRVGKNTRSVKFVLVDGRSDGDN